MSAHAVIRAVGRQVTGGDPPRVFRAGEVFFVEDTTGEGHHSRAVGGRPRKSVFIGIPDDVLRE
jgi:hypothetical protein